MYSLKNECCHAIACLPSKLETGCRQVLHKLKSCEETEKKGTSEETGKVRCSQKTIVQFTIHGPYLGLAGGGEGVNKDRKTCPPQALGLYYLLLVPLQPLLNLVNVNSSARLTLKKFESSREQPICT